jgi:hypothetical protein
VSLIDSLPRMRLMNSFEAPWNRTLIYLLKSWFEFARVKKSRNWLSVKK